MAKESMKAREVKRAKMVAKYAEKRAALKKIINNPNTDPVDAFEAAQKLQAIPRNANRNASIKKRKRQGSYSRSIMSAHC